MSIFQIWNDSVHRNLPVIIVRIHWQDEQDYILENNCSMNKYRVYHVVFIVVCGQWRLSIKKAVKKILDRFFAFYSSISSSCCGSFGSGSFILYPTPRILFKSRGEPGLSILARNLFI